MMWQDTWFTLGVAGLKYEQSSKRVLAITLACTLLILTPSLFIRSVALQGSVHGVVVDENGVPLDGVQVQAYTQDGALAGSTYTEGGYFNIFLGYGSYTIYFIKGGYAKVSKNILLQSIDLDVGNITLYRVIRLSTTSFELASFPGDTLTIPFTISNLGSDVETVSFYPSMPAGWVTRVLDSGREVLSVLLPPGQTMPLQLEIAVPSTASAGIRYNLTLTASGTVNSTLNLIIFVKPQPASYVTGRVLDEDGLGLDAVQVQALSPDGSVAAAAYTSRDGFFNLTLTKSSPATIVFSKDGYVKVSKSLVPQYSIINLGDTVLQKAIKLSTSIVSLVVSPGSSVLLPFTVSNLGERSELLQLSVDAGGWSSRILTQSNVEVYSVIVSPGQTMPLQLEVFVPESFVGERSLILTVKGVIESTLVYSIKVAPSSERILLCDLPGKSVSPGGTVNFKLTLRNIMDSTQRFSFLYSAPSGWTVSLKASSGEEVSEVVLDGGKAVDLTVSIITPPEAAAGAYNVTFNASSPFASDTITLSVNVQKPVTDIRFEASPPYVDVYAGSNARFKLKVTNLGSSSELLNISMGALGQGLVGWFEDPSKQEITKIYVGAGESKEFYAVISVPKGAKLGSQSFPVQVSNSDVNRTVTLTLNVLGLYDVTVTNQNFYTSLNVGGGSTYSLVVKNTGSEAVTNLKLAPGTLPDGFTVTVEPSYIYSLPADQEATFTISIQTQSDVNAGSYYIDFTLLSDQTQAKQFTLRVDVLQQTSWIIYASVLLLIAIVGLFFIYRRFGRR